MRAEDPLQKGGHPLQTSTFPPMRLAGQARALVQARDWLAADSHRRHQRQIRVGYWQYRPPKYLRLTQIMAYADRRRLIFLNLFGACACRAFGRLNRRLQFETYRNHPDPF